MSSHDPTEEQDLPTPNEHPVVWELVMGDLQAKAEAGADKYGTHLQPHNGRSALRDAYQEALDLCMYMRQKIYEEEGQ